MEPTAAVNIEVSGGAKALDQSMSDPAILGYLSDIGSMEWALHCLGEAGWSDYRIIRAAVDAGWSCQRITVLTVTWPRERLYNAMFLVGFNGVILDETMRIRDCVEEVIAAGTREPICE